MEQQIQQIKMTFTQMNNQLNNNNKNCVNGNRTSGGNNFPFWRQLYFCTHGALHFQKFNCSYKSEGHKDTAKFDKHLNGSGRNFRHREKKNNA